jgi:large subunit ribosomal protein L23
MANAQTVNAASAVRSSVHNKWYQVILTSHISEKATRVSERYNQFVFDVEPSATKPQIKSAVEFCFKVKVKAVNTLNVKGKRKYFGQRIGRRNNEKKAYVTLEPGYDIDFVVTDKS